MKKHLILLFFAITLFNSFLYSQEKTSTFNFLNLPSSSHVTALGGKNISIIEDDISTSYQNPALLSNVNNKTIGFQFMSFMKGGKSGGAAYCQHHRERGTWGANIQFVGYGSMTETDEFGNVLGEMSPLDMVINGTYCYLLGNNWAGGVTGKVIYSKYGSFSACALAVDLGLNYYSKEKKLSFSAAVNNLGGQVKAFGDHHDKLPFDLQIGLTKRMEHAPIRLSVTLFDLTRWSQSYYHSFGKEMSAGRIFTNHLNFGVDILPTEQFYLSMGYNCRRAYEMKAAGSSHGAGLSFGAGINLTKFKLGLAYGKYYVGAPTLSISLAYSLL